LEFDKTYQPLQTDADVIVAAGDIATKGRGIKWLRESFPGKPVVYVAGNHEYYGNAIPHFTDKLREEATEYSVHFLENTYCVIGDVLFLGCTLWTDFDLFGDRHKGKALASESMNDYQMIRVDPKLRKATPEDTLKWHRGSVEFVKAAAKSPAAKGKKLVVVTHHAPSLESCAPHYRQDKLSSSFASNLEPLVEEVGAKLWVHGHCHTAVGYQIGPTRVICNPKGYPSERNNGFTGGLVVEV
jgi:Icc-related predicted phosphoesterase